ncbi:hypothetical protein QYE76_004624 [Lolium multiflorum]|uniref:Malectin-like domain-containing protein n=1 Tax=Lolium multiflorum TaxID=4521 RepID=A0AAD8RSF9_LOLMU|nr:hypothetical protein QYE76_004624 [Lolium multiflorum]
MASIVLFGTFVLAATAVHAAGQAGFLIIDCGLDAALSGRQDSDRKITYVSDGPYVDGGENHKIADDLLTSASGDASLRTLRSFPSGLRNCYTLPTESGAKYLVRLNFFHGNYDGKNNPSSVQFDLHLGTNYWETMTLKTIDRVYSEAVFVAWASWVPVCLINTGSGTPFVNTVELRALGTSLYPNVNINASMSTYDRINFGTDAFIRFPDDPYDRYWTTWLSPNPAWTNLSTQDAIAQQDQDSFAVPSHVLQTAISTAGNGTVLNVLLEKGYQPSLMFRLFLHFTDFQKSQLRQFDVYINNEKIVKYSLTYMAVSSVQNPGWSNTDDGNFNITLAATNISLLPPMISALELFKLIPNITSRTFSNDFDAMMAIKYKYGVKKNWNGDPCFPANYAWNGVKCSNSTDRTTRIISLDLSDRIDI